MASRAPFRLHHLKRICYHAFPLSGTATVTPEFVDALGDLLTDYVGLVLDIESRKTQDGRKGIYSVKELRVMHTIFRRWRRDEPCTVTQLANATGISKTTVSRAVTSLMTNGLLKEQIDPEDGRKRLLLPTEQGEQTLAGIMDWLNDWAARLMNLAAGVEPQLPAIVVGEKRS